MQTENNHSNVFSIEEYSGDYQLRFTNVFDLKAKFFEVEKIQTNPTFKAEALDEEGIIRQLPWTRISFWQSADYLTNQSLPYYVLQMSNQKTNCHYQIALRVETSKIPFFKTGIVEKWTTEINPETQHDIDALMNHLLRFIKRYTPLMNLKISCYLPGVKQLNDLQAIMEKRKFTRTGPRSYTKTRMMDLRPSIPDIEKSFSTNGRSRLKKIVRDSDKIEVRAISDDNEIPSLQNALNDSYLRSTKSDCLYNFKSVFRGLASNHQKLIFLGFYLKNSLNPTEPKAFVTGVKHNSITEYSVGGSLSDQALREFPFNHILLWKLAMLSKDSGSELFDLGGITNGETFDPLAKISSFKRLFPGFEMTVGRDMGQTIRPRRYQLYNILQKTILLVRKLRGQIS